MASWSDINGGRKEAGGLPHILKLPILGDRRDLLLRAIKDGDRLLDIGAHDRAVEGLLKGAGRDVDYFSLDTDRNLTHDYYDIEDVQGTFDVVAVLEVIEHMEFSELKTFFERVRSLLKEGGRLAVSTPNVCHPVVFWRDCTHRTPVRYDELYGLLVAAGFDGIELYRMGSFGLRKRLLALYYRPLLRLMRMDFAPGIAALARRGSRP